MRGDAMELYVTDEAEGFWIIHEDAEPIHIDTSDLGSAVGVLGADLDDDGDQDVIARIRTGGACDERVGRVRAARRRSHRMQRQRRPVAHWNVSEQYGGMFVVGSFITHGDGLVRYG